MGYVHDTHMHHWLSAMRWFYVTGTWAAAAGVVANTAVMKRTAGDGLSTVTIPIGLPSNDGPSKGCYIQSIDIYFEITANPLDSLAATIYLATLPADGAAVAAPASQTFTYDTGHDAAGERIDVDQHKMTLTITTPVWIEEDQLLTVEIAIDNAAASVIEFLGALVNYTYRL